MLTSRSPARSAPSCACRPRRRIPISPSSWSMFIPTARPTTRPMESCDAAIPENWPRRRRPRSRLTCCPRACCSAGGIVSGSRFRVVTSPTTIAIRIPAATSPARLIPFWRTRASLLAPTRHRCCCCRSFRDDAHQNIGRKIVVIPDARSANFGLIAGRRSRIGHAQCALSAASDYIPDLRVLSTVAFETRKTTGLGSRGDFGLFGPRGHWEHR